MKEDLLENPWGKAGKKRKKIETNEKSKNENMEVATLRK
jgi:hypothetical protein